MIVMNERKWAEYILETGDLGNPQWSAVHVLARYFYQVEGLKKSEITQKLDALLRQLVPDYDPYRWDSIIEKAVSKAKNRSLVEIDAIPVTGTEMDLIDALETVQLRRLAFTMLVLAKYFDMRRDTNNHWVNLDIREVFKAACVSCTIADQAKYYRTLIEKNLIAYSHKVGNNNAQVLFMDDGEPVMQVTDLRDIGHAYQMYHGEPYFYCQRCGVLTRQNKYGNRKYCKECADGAKIGMRKYDCIDCGRTMFVVSRNHSACRCPECQTKARKRGKLESQRKIRSMKTSSTNEESDANSLKPVV